MFIYKHCEEEESGEKRMYQGEDLACLYHFMLYGENLGREPKNVKRKLFEKDENENHDDNN